MKKVIPYLFLGLCLFGHVHAEISFFGELTGRCTWDFDMRKKLTNVLKALIPNDKERQQWILENDIENIGDYNRTASAEWKPRKDFRTAASESISCMFCNMKRKFGRQYKSVDELFKAETRYRQEKSHIPLTIECRKLNDFEGVMEMNDSNSKRILRVTIDGDWVVNLEYYLNKNKSPEKWENWEKYRDFWLERFAPIRFN